MYHERKFDEKVKEEKISSIRKEIIDGKKCLVIPLEDHEGAMINGEKERFL